MRTKKQKDKKLANRNKRAWGFFYATTICSYAGITTPAPYVSCTGQAACRDFDKGDALGGVWHCKIRRLLPCQRYWAVVLWLEKTPMRFTPQLQKGGRKT
jgi:hypothetical protein